MSPPIPNSHPQTPSSALNPNTPPFNNPPAPRRSTPLALLPSPPTKTQTHTDAKISPLPLKPTAAGDHSHAFFYHPAVIPNPNRLFFYYYCYPLPHTQPNVLHPSPVYMNNNNYYHSGGFRPIAICPQPSPPPLILNHGTETVPVPVPEPKPLPTTVVPNNGGDRALIIFRNFL
ncbi:unnamed protein product [Linum trigynum]|uniref:Uncharacterized protein n=1 Tax=Linum trigynum TaxID=586398 RepID=A0AAV2FAE9_9ROSI